MYKICLSLVVLSILCGCSTIQITSDSPSALDVTKLKTYSWLNVDGQNASDIRLQDKQVDATITHAVNKELKSKGYTKVEGDKADFRVSWVGAIDKKVTDVSISHFYRPYGYGPLYKDGSNTNNQGLSPREYEEGRIIIDFFDTKSHKLIWRGIGSDKINSERSPEESLALIRSAVQKILVRFPAKRN